MQRYDCSSPDSVTLFARSDVGANYAYEVASGFERLFGVAMRNESVSS
jgi:hypothetical protein